MPVYLNRSIDPVSSFNFPGGEVHVRLSDPLPTRVDEVLAVIKTSDDLMRLILTVDALKRAIGFRPTDARLIIPYMPYARQDRVANKGEPHSLAVAAKLINSLGFGEVAVWDAHSIVVEGVINNCLPSFGLEEIISPPAGKDHFGDYLKKYRKQLVLVAPDAGALKRVERFAKHFNLPHVINLRKSRDPVTGALSGVVLNWNDVPGGLQPFPSTRFLIVDDICDGGQTFINVAAAIHEYTDAKVDLFVTHGIFSKGVGNLDPEIDTVFSTNSLLQRADLPVDAILTAQPASVNSIGLA